MILKISVRQTCSKVEAFWSKIDEKNVDTQSQKLNQQPPEKYSKFKPGETK